MTERTEPELVSGRLAFHASPQRAVWRVGVVATLLLIGGLGLWFAGAAGPAPVRGESSSPSRPTLAFAPAEKLAPLDASMRESSGLAASRTRPGWLWTHGDSGGGPRLMRFDPNSRASEAWTVRRAVARDWEDMASFEWEGRPFLLVADTGDNVRDRASVALHLIPEPDGAEQPEPRFIEPAVTLHVTYADGPRDCEALGVDAARGVIWLVSKEIDAGGRMYGRSGLYAVALPPVGEEFDEATQLGTPDAPLVLDRKATLHTVMPTAMDITADGRAMLIATYGDALLLERDPADDPDWVHAVAAGAARVELPPRRQGEGLCFSVDGSAVFLSSEKPEQPIWRIAVE